MLLSHASFIWCKSVLAKPKVASLSFSTPSIPILCTDVSFSTIMHHGAKAKFFSNHYSFCSHITSGFLKLCGSTVHWLSYDEGQYADKLLFVFEEQIEYNLFYRFRLTDFLLYWNCGDFQCVLFCFVTGSKWWTQLSSPTITHLITSSILFSHLQHISVWQFLCSGVKKWGTQQAATPHIFSFLHRLILSVTNAKENNIIYFNWRKANN